MPNRITGPKRVSFSADDDFVAFLLNHWLNGDADYLGIGVVGCCSLNEVSKASRTSAGVNV